MNIVTNSKFWNLFSELKVWVRVEDIEIELYAKRWIGISSNLYWFQPISDLLTCFKRNLY